MIYLIISPRLMEGRVISSMPVSRKKMADRINPELERNASDGVHRLPENSKACRKIEGIPL
jgi:hypothetical protein